jgi:hypothetical protein
MCTVAGMLNHLADFEPDVTDPGDFKPLKKAQPNEVLSAQYATADWLEQLGVTPDEEIVDGLETSSAREAFQAMVTVTDNEKKKEALVELKTPLAVRQLTGMLTAYDWEFVQQAKELRGYTVAKILEETTSNNPNIRLKALALLGKVTEVGLFTEKIEIKKNDMSDSELETRIKEKLNRFMQVVDVVDVNESQQLHDA